MTLTTKSETKGALMNPKSYCTENGIRTADFIARAQEIAPKYNKVAHCI